MCIKKISWMGHDLLAESANQSTATIKLVKVKNAVNLLFSSSHTYPRFTMPLFSWSVVTLCNTPNRSAWQGWRKEWSKTQGSCFGIFSLVTNEIEETASRNLLVLF